MLTGKSAYQGTGEEPDAEAGQYLQQSAFKRLKLPRLIEQDQRRDPGAEGNDRQGKDELRGYASRRAAVLPQARQQAAGENADEYA